MNSLHFPAMSGVPFPSPRGKAFVGATCGRPFRGGGYHPPVFPRNCWPRGARRLGAPSVGATCGHPPFAGAPPGGGPARRAHRFCCQKRWENHQGPRFLRWLRVDVYRRRPRRLRPRTRSPWRQWAVIGWQEPGRHRRPFPWEIRYRRCRASGGTHRDYPADPGSSCAVPSWPAGPPAVPCL